MNALILALGSNQGDREKNLLLSISELKKNFKFLEESRIYHSEAVDYTQQPSFYNQVLSFKKPSKNPQEVLEKILEVEKHLGRVRHIPRGPRTIDIDILFYGLRPVCEKNLQIPHPRLFERSFVVRPLSELKVFKELEKSFKFPRHFEVEAYPLEKSPAQV